jgi:biopolymer transport protein TolR
VGVLDEAPATPIMVRADQSIDYGLVVDAMVAAQAAGAPSVGLVTQPPPGMDAARGPG